MEFFKKLKENGACQVDIEFVKDGHKITVWQDEGGFADGFSVVSGSLEQALRVALEELIEERR